MDANLLREPLERALRRMDDSSLSLDFITEEALADFQEVLNGRPAADACAYGPINGMGEPDPLGSYIRLSVIVFDQVETFKISMGAATALVHELVGSIDRRSLRGRIKTTTGKPVVETDEQIALALRWYRRQSSRHALMAQIDEQVAVMRRVEPILDRAESNSSGNPEFSHVGPCVAAFRTALAKATD